MSYLKNNNNVFSIIDTAISGMNRIVGHEKYKCSYTEHKIGDQNVFAVKITSDNDIFLRQDVFSKSKITEKQKSQVWNLIMLMMVQYALNYSMFK